MASAQLKQFKFQVDPKQFQLQNNGSSECNAAVTLQAVSIPPGCSASYQVIENGSVSWNWFTTVPGSQTFPVACGCGDFHIQATVTPGGLCSGGTQTLVDATLSVACDDDDDTGSGIDDNCGSAPLLPEALEMAAQACQAPDLNTTALNQFDRYQQRLENTAEQLQRLGATPHNQGFQVQSQSDKQIERLQAQYAALQESQAPYTQALSQELELIEQQLQQIYTAYPAHLRADLVLPDASELLDSTALNTAFDQLESRLQALIQEDRSYALATAIVDYSKMLKIYQLALQDRLSPAPRYDLKASELLALQNRVAIIAPQLSQQQARLSSQLQAAAAALGIAPQDFDAAAYSALESEVYGLLDEIEEALEAFNALRAEQQGFSVQANNNHKSNNQRFVERAMQALEDKYRTFSQRILNTRNYTTEEVERARTELMQQIQATREVIGQHSPIEWIQKYDAMVTPLGDNLGGLPAEQFRLIATLRMYLIQCIGAADPEAFRYFNDLSSVRAFFMDGKITPPHDMKVFASPQDIKTLPPDIYNYVVTDDNRFVTASRGDRESGTKHTQLTGGAKAKAGGEIRIHANGKVDVNNESGRYRMQESQAIDQVVKYLRTSGAQIKKVSGAF